MAETITIANAKDLPPVAEWPEWYAYVGRRDNRRGLPASPLRNPWRVGKPSHVGAGVFFGVHHRRVTVPKGNLTRDDVKRLCRESMAVGIWRKEPTTLAEIARLRALHEKHGKLVLVQGAKDHHAEVIKEALEAEG